MGITIHYRFGINDEKALDRLLSKTKELAERLDMEIIEFELGKDVKSLIISPHVDCENVSLVFEKWGSIKKKWGNSKEWNYQYSVLSGYKEEFNGKISDLFDPDMWVCADFTKTQFAGDITHIKVCLILRYVASFCSFVDIYDEAEYYETLDKEKLLENFGENARLIREVADVFKKMGFKVKSGFDG